GPNRLARANGPTGESRSDGENRSARENGSANGSDEANRSVGTVASTSIGVGESNEVGELSRGQAVEPRWVNDKSHDHMSIRMTGSLQRGHPRDNIRATPSGISESMVGTSTGREDARATPVVVTPFATREQIEGHLSALRSLLTEKNSRNNISLIRLNFDDVEDQTIIRTVVTGKEIADVDLKEPFKEADHLSRFSSAANLGEWPMLVWCRMFQQTLDRSVRSWFENLLIGSIDGWTELRQQFTTSTQKFVDEIGELREIFGRMLGAVRVQIPENNFDNLHSSREEDGTLEAVDPQDLLGCDLLALVDDITPVEDNIGLLETRFHAESVLVFVFLEDVTSSVNLTLLSLFFRVTTTNLSLELLMLGQLKGMTYMVDGINWIVTLLV
nr:hypothetical protein [Tanacetum cinerariifolium]